jgi:hypothetical protein
MQLAEARVSGLRYSSIPLLFIGTILARHLGRDCRDPEAMDSNAKPYHPFFGYGAGIFELFFHIPVFWIPAIPAGMTEI